MGGKGDSMHGVVAYVHEDGVHTCTEADSPLEHQVEGDADLVHGAEDMDILHLENVGGSFDAWDEQRKQGVEEAVLMLLGCRAQ